MGLQEINTKDVFCLIMNKAELTDLIKVVKWFAETEAELSLKQRWQMLDDLIDVKRQEQWRADLGS